MTLSDAFMVHIFERSTYFANTGHRWGWHLDQVRGFVSFAPSETENVGKELKYAETRIKKLIQHQHSEL